MNADGSKATSNDDISVNILKSVVVIHLSYKKMSLICQLKKVISLINLSLWKLVQYSKRKMT